MGELLNNFGVSDFVTSDRMLGLGRAVLILVVGILVARLASRAAARGLQRRVGAQEAMLVCFWVPLASCPWPSGSRHRHRFLISLAECS